MKNKFNITEFSSDYSVGGNKEINISATINPLPRNAEELNLIIINSYLEKLNIRDDITTILKNHYPEVLI